MKDIILEKFTATSFHGIDSKNPIVIDFTSRRKNQNVIEFVGDQGVGKSSTLYGLLYAMGGAFDIDKKQLFNNKDKAIDIDLKFKHGGSQYHVLVNDGRFILKKYYKESDKWKNEDEPLTTLRNMFGPVGLSPFGLRQVEGKKQIQFFRDTFGGGEEASKKERQIQNNIDTLFAQRRDVNRDIKTLKGALEADPLYQNYEKSQTKFKSAPNPKKEKEEFDALAEKYAAFNNAKSGLDVLKNQKKNHEKTIADLRERLAQEEKALASVEKRIVDGDAYIKKNAGIVKEYEEANEAWVNLSKSIAEHERWKGILKKEKEMHELEDASNAATGQLDKLRTDLLKLTKSYLPKIPGLDISVKTGLDDDKEGVFYQDKSLAQLSESEYVDLWVKIYDDKDVNFVFIENSTSLGSTAVDTLNQLAKNGAEIFATRMNREKETMDIVFNTKLG